MLLSGRHVVETEPEKSHEDNPAEPLHQEPRGPPGNRSAPGGADVITQLFAEPNQLPSSGQQRAPRSAHTLASGSNRALLRKLRSFNPTVFPWTKNRRKLFTQLHYLQKTAGVKPEGHKPNIGFHDFRRAFATMNAGRMTADALQVLMQHKDYQTTQRYVNLARQLNPAIQDLYVPTVGTNWNWANGIAVLLQFVVLASLTFVVTRLVAWARLELARLAAQDPKS